MTTQIQTERPLFDREAFERAMRIDLRLLKLQAALAAVSGIALAILLFA